MRIVRESISFERGLDPKSAMGLGLTKRIEQWYQDAYDMEPSEGMLGVIMEDDELDKETKQEWTKHLISSGYEFDSDAVGASFSNSIDLVEYLPNGWTESIHSLELQKKNGKFYVIFDGWDEFSDFELKQHNQDKEYTYKVLSGDAWDYFDNFDNAWVDADSVQNFIKNNKDQIKSLGYLRDLYQYKAEDNERDYVEFEDDIDELIDDIWDNDIYEDLKSALQIAGGVAYANAQEGEAYRYIIKEIQKHYELGDAKWDDHRKRYTSQISVDGVERLLDSYYFGDRSWEHSPPYNGYMPDWNVEAFEMELQNQLENNVS